MKLKYETGIATLVQFIVMSLFGIANAINSIVTACVHHNAKAHTDLLSLITSISDMVLAAFVILLAIRVFRSKGGRIVTKQTQRRRRKHPTTDL